MLALQRRLLQAARHDVSCLWREASRAQRWLYSCGLVLVLHAIVHLVPLAFAPLPWDGKISWRKPILFGVSAGTTAISLGWVLGLCRPSTWDENSLLLVPLG